MQKSPTHSERPKLGRADAINRRCDAFQTFSGVFKLGYTCRDTRIKLYEPYGGAEWRGAHAPALTADCICFHFSPRLQFGLGFVFCVCFFVCFFLPWPVVVLVVDLTFVVWIPSNRGVRLYPALYSPVLDPRRSVRRTRSIKRRRPRLKSFKLLELAKQKNKRVPPAPSPVPSLHFFVFPFASL